MTWYEFVIICLATSTGLFAFSANAWRKMYEAQRVESKAWAKLADENLELAKQFEKLAVENLELARNNVSAT